MKPATVSRKITSSPGQDSVGVVGLALLGYRDPSYPGSAGLTAVNHPPDIEVINEHAKAEAQKVC